MPGAVFLENDEVELRTIEEEDLEFIRDNFNHPEVRSGLSNFRPVNMEKEEEWFEEAVCESEDVHLAISEDGEIRGVISLIEQDEEEVAEIGIWVGKDFQGQGLGTAASELIIEHGFNQLNYHKLIAKAYKSNTASQKIWEKIGFEKEGELREQIYRKGSYENVFVYGLLEQDR